jgi:glycosyltransferase involved in cell wall biosynthesis
VSSNLLISASEPPVVAVVLPAYNEELTIEAVIGAFHQALPRAQIWVINNRSSDRTQERATLAIARLACQGGVINESRPGKGHAMRRAFMDIDADVYVLADADMTYPANEVHALLRPVLAGEADMVVGDRHSSGGYAAENKRIFHSFGNQLVRDLVNLIFKSHLKDIMSGYRVLTRRFVKNYPILVSGFEIETDMTMHALDKRFRIVEVPVRYLDRPQGSVSKLNTVRDGLRVLFMIGNIMRYYRPMLFFGGAALFMAVLGLAAGAPVIIEWLRYHYIFRVPLAILATGTEIVAFVLASIALVLDSITHQDRRNFERQLLSQGNEGWYSPAQK